MTEILNLQSVDEAGVRRLAELVALKVRAGDVVTLDGDLGAGKTTFARALVRALLGDADADVPSPTFALVQSYRSPRLAIAHADLYRLSQPDEMQELGLADAARQGVVLVEWPERGDGIDRLGQQLSISIADRPGDPDRRDITLRASGSWPDRLARIGTIWCFLASVTTALGTGPLRITYLQGDASPRSYARIADGRNAFILMDAPRRPDGPPIRDGLPYSRIAHLAEDVRPFVAIDRLLRDAGLSAPAIALADLDQGLLLIEDLGEGVFGAELARGTAQETLWMAAADVLVALRRVSVPTEIRVDDGPPHVLPAYDRGALAIETELFVDWYWPALHGAPPPDHVRAEFTALWDNLFDRLLTLPQGLVLRDYHSPNLMWLPQREGVARIGILDFQDAMRGPWAYDAVSLFQDARLDVSAELEAQLLAHYMAAVERHEPGFDRKDFRFAYAALGAQRNTKILGIFARLARRDGKAQYLAHVPRIWGYLARCLAHPDLAPLAAWYDRHVPKGLRSRGIARV